MARRGFDIQSAEQPPCWAMISALQDARHIRVFSDDPDCRREENAGLTN